MKEIKNCPFCGSPVKNYDIEYDQGVPSALTVRCNCGVEITCNANVVYFDNFDGTTETYAPWGNAFDMWNRRADNGGAD